MLRTVSLVIVTLALGAGQQAWAQGYNGGSGTVPVPNGLSGPGGTMTFTQEPAVQGGEISGGIGRVPRGSLAPARNPVLDRPGVQSDQRR